MLGEIVRLGCEVNDHAQKVPRCPGRTRSGDLRCKRTSTARPSNENGVYALNPYMHCILKLARLVFSALPWINNNVRLNPFAGVNKRAGG